jgi:hypothetical protein
MASWLQRLLDVSHPDLNGFFDLFSSRVRIDFTQDVFNAGFHSCKSADNSHFCGLNPTGIELFVRHGQDGCHFMMHLADGRHEVVYQGPKEVEDNSLKLHKSITKAVVRNPFRLGSRSPYDQFIASDSYALL